MAIMTKNIPLFPLLIIFASIFFSYMISIGKIKVHWGLRLRITYWLMPVISFFLLSIYLFLYANYSHELGNGALGLFVMIPMSVLFPILSYVGMLYLENKKTAKIIWITPTFTVFFYLVLYVLIIIIDSKDKDKGDVFSLFLFFCVFIYFNSINVFPLITLMIARIHGNMEIETS